MSQPDVVLDLVAAGAYNQLSSIHGIIIVFFFLVPIAPADVSSYT
jgi:cytochrome c oxidase subunit I